jgi:ATP-binding cassette, subfamily C, type I secretion system permease/ATPase
VIRTANQPDELQSALGAGRHYFITALIFSLAINLLYLAAPLYMLQVYDRVITSASQATLVMLTLVLMLALGSLAGLDVVRARVLTRAGVRLDRLLAGRVFAATMEGALKGGPSSSQMLRDFDTFRQFVTGAGIHAVFDLPWAPIYILIIFLLHPLLGLFALLSALALIGLAVFGQWRVQGPSAEASDVAARNYAFTEMSLRNAEVVQALGMLPGLLMRWNRDRGRAIERQVVANDRSASTTSLIRFLRLSMQSLILGLGAYLAIERLITIGAMFAATILLGRALQPVEQIVGSWRAMISARGAFARIKGLLAANPLRDRSLALPRPVGRLSVEGLVYGIPRSPSPILRGISFQLDPGDVLGVIGPSGAGKSTLARQIIGVLAPSAGAVRLDGADVSTWPRELLGRYLGYLPQDIELFADTVAANLGRFRTEGNDNYVIEAAKLAGVHDTILRLPEGYDTNIGDSSKMLSGGIRQRIGLARAVYGSPSLVVLDEPSSNLDSDGDAALLSCITDLKQRGVTVVMISHRPNTLSVVDKLLVMRDGMVEAFGPRNEVVARVTRLAPVHPVAAAKSR